MSGRRLGTGCVLVAMLVACVESKHTFSTGEGGTSAQTGRAGNATGAQPAEAGARPTDGGAGADGPTDGGTGTGGGTGPGDDGPEPMAGGGGFTDAGAGMAGAGAPSDGGVGGTLPVDCTSCTPTAILTSAYLVALTVQAPLAYYVDVPTGVANGQKSQLLRVTTNGGTPEPVTLGAADSKLTGLLADGAYIYSAQYEIARTPTVGGTSFTVLEGSPQYVAGSASIRTNSTHVFAMWGLSQQHVTRLPKSGGQSNGPAISPLLDWLGFDVDDANVYVFTKSIISRFPVASIDGMEATTVAVAEPNETFSRLRVAGQSLLLGTSTRVALVDKGAGALSSLAVGAVVALGNDSTTAYYFRANAGGGSTCSAGSKLYATPLAGGNEQHLASEGAGCPIEMNQDATAVYWLSADRKQIRKAPKTPR